MEVAKRIPYGISNFVEVVEQNQYYVDKTMYLPMLEEQPSNLFFIRPRRFGKSIFLSMLRAYYDIAQKEKFQKRFGNLWIGDRESIDNFFLSQPFAVGRLPVGIELESGNETACTGGNRFSISPACSTCRRGHLLLGS